MRKTFFIVIPILLACFSIAAQDKQKLYTDSTALPEEETTVTESGDAEQATADLDTTLYNLRLNISADSVNALKKDGPYAYMQYLDSLLKERQKKKDAVDQQKNNKNSRQSSSGSNDFSITQTSQNNFFASSGTRAFLWILAGAFILFVIYKLFLGDGMFRKKTTSLPQVQDGKEEVITSESDIDALISAALRNKNYRLAIRYWYLKSLHHLSERGLLQMAADKTNYQYVNEIKNTVQRNEFASLTLNYEYVWYGEFEVDDILYQRLENNFSSFVKKV